MNITTYTDRLTPINALNGKTILHADFNTKAQEIILKALFRLGQSKDDMTLDLMVTEFVKDIRLDFATLTIPEVELAIDNGIKNKDVVMINNKTLYSLVKEYAQGETRRKAKLALNEVTKIEPVMTKDESYKAWKYTVIRQFHEFKKSGVFLVEFPKFLFERLEKFGNINLSDADKKRIYEQAVKDVIEKKKRSRLNCVGNKRSEITNFINRHEAKQSTKEDVEHFKEEARIIAIKEYWRGVDVFELP
jgi:hypothetical protein